MAGQGKRSRLEYKLVAGETGYSIEEKVRQASNDGWRLVIGSFQVSTFGYFIWMERFIDAREQEVNAEVDRMVGRGAKS